MTGPVMSPCQSTGVTRFIVLKQQPPACCNHRNVITTSDYVSSLSCSISFACQFIAVSVNEKSHNKC